MKAIPTSIFAAILATSLPAFSQQEVRPPRARIEQPIRVPSQNEIAGFPGNVKLTLEGNLFGVVPTDFSILSGGSSFSTDLPVKMDSTTPIIGTLEGALTPGAPWTVQIVLSARVPFQIGSNIEFRDFKFRTSARIASGKKVTLWEKDGQKLVLGLEEVPD